MASPLSHHAAGASNARNRRRQPDRSSPGSFCLRFPPALQSRHVTNRTADRNDCHRRASAIPALDGPVPPRHAGAAQPTQRADRRHRRGDHGRGGQLPVGVHGAAGRDPLPGGPADRHAGADGDAAGDACGRIPVPPRHIVPWFARSRFVVLICYLLTGLVPFSSRTARRGDHRDLGAGDAAADASLGGVHCGDGRRRRTDRPLHADEPALGYPGADQLPHGVGRGPGAQVVTSFR